MTQKYEIVYISDTREKHLSYCNEDELTYIKTWFKVLSIKEVNRYVPV